jgi:predicted transcriptional regulator
MKIQLDLPEALATELYARCRDKQLSVDEYASEILGQYLASEALAEDGRIESRPDWQQALARARADLRAGRVVPHDEIEKWHRTHRS